MKLNALIFDFDGLILDTETPEYLVWKNIYHEHGFELPHDEWSKIIGGYGLSNFDAAQHLSHLSQGQLDPVSLRDRHRFESGSAIASNPIMPGVESLIHEAKKNNLRLAIASSSPHSWVDAHAKRLGIFQHFDQVICADDVAPGRTKPNPDLFLKALDQLQVRNDAAIVFEDSPNGVKAANRAGIFVVAVPNETTIHLEFDDPSLRFDSLDGISLQTLSEYFEVK